MKTEPAVGDGSQLRIASYNIHRCIGTDGHYQPDRIRRVLHGLDARIVARQEVESGQHHGELLEYFIEDSDWRFIEGPALVRETGRYGNAVLTSLPLLRYRLIDLSFKDREPRGAIDVSLQHRDMVIRMIATHLGLSSAERRMQTRRLHELLNESTQGPADLTLLMGDMNEWLPWGGALRCLRSWFEHAYAPRTYPTRWPILPLDRIWVRPRKYLLHTATCRTELSRRASDHYSLVATLETA